MTNGDEDQSKHHRVLNREPVFLNPKHKFPYRAHNQFQLLIDGRQFYRAMLADILSAQAYILFETYLWESGEISKQFIHAFTSAADRGVQIFIILDNFGANKLEQEERYLLKHPQISVHTYNPIRLVKLFKNLHRNHRKLLLVDGASAFVGGTGVSDSFAYSDHNLFTLKAPWRETMLKVRGECVQDWHRLFMETWENETASKANLLSATENKTLSERSVGRVLGTATENQNFIQQSLINAINKSKRDVWIATPYFVPSLKLRRTLRSAARRGIKIHIILPGQYTDNVWVRRFGQRFYMRLLLAGIQVYEYQKRFMHQKIALCDNWITIGSSNFDRWSFRWNLEANQEIVDPDFAEQIRKMLQQDLRHCQQITIQSWKQRNSWTKIVDYLITTLDRWTDPILNLLSRRR